MRPERVDRISFRFTRGELAALLKLMGLQELRDTSVQAADPESSAVQSLIESGIVMSCGERTFVDGTISLVLKNAALSGSRLTVRGPESSLVLYRGERMYVLVEESGELVTLEPLQDLTMASGPFAAAAGRLGNEVRARLTGAGLPDAGAEGPGAAEKLLGQWKDSEVQMGCS